MRTTFSVAVDTAFVLLISFVLSLVFFYYYTPYPFSVIISAAVSVIFCVLFRFFTKNKTEKQRVKKEDEEKYENAMLNLAFMNRTRQLAFIRALFEKEYGKVKTEKGAIVINGGLAIFPRFSFSPVKKDEILKAVEKFSSPVAVLSESFSEEELRFAAKFGNRITLISGKQIFYKMKKHDLFPEEKIKVEKHKKRKIFLSFPLEKKKAVSFLCFGLFFLIFSFFAPIKTYYIASGVVFLGFSLFLRLFGKVPT